MNSRFWGLYKKELKIFFALPIAYAIIMVFMVLAIIATPLFPGFFIMLATILQAFSGMPAIAIGVAVVWLLWSWSGARLLQGIIAGPAGDDDVLDLNGAVTWGYGLVLMLLMVSGIYGIGELL